MKPTVLQLIDSFHQGGTERQAVQLTRLLHESHRYHLHVACLNRDGVLLNEVERLGLEEIKEYPLTSFYDRNALKQLRRLVSFLRQRKVDLIQTHDFYTNVFGMLAAKLARVPVRIASRRETGGMRSGAQSFVQRRAYRQAHSIVANAEAVRAQLVTEGVPAEKVKVIYNGLDTERLATPDMSREEGLALFNLLRDERLRFVTIVANMRHEVKDQATFLRAAKRIQAAVPDAAFVLAGEGELMDALKMQAAELGLASSAFFIGRCANVPALLNLSDVCVLSSTNEGFSNSILEYMAAARPVVATDVGGAREAVVEGETGHLVAPGDDEAMAARIIALLREPERAREIGSQGQRRVRQKFSCEAQLAETERLYDGLLANALASALGENILMQDAGR